MAGRMSQLGRSLAQGLGQALDTTIGIFSPAREAFRQQERARSESFRRYAAARDDLQTGGWGLHDHNVNQVIGDSAARLRARVRQLVRDFPFFARVVEAAVNLSVSTGIQLQYLMTKADGHTVDNELNRRVEDAWADFCERPDAGGRLDFVEMQRLARRQEVEVGEAFALTVYDLADQDTPLKVQLYEPDWLNDFGAQAAPGNKLVQGIEIDQKSGRVAAYHLEDPEHWGQPLRVEPRFAVHTYQTLRPGQLRGVSPLAAAVLAAHDIGEYIGAEVDGAKKAAAYLATAKTPNPQQYAMQRGKLDPSGVRVRHLSHGIIEVLHNDEDFKLLDHNRPGGQFEPTVNFITRMIAVTAGLTPELVSGDYRGINYSNLRGIRSDLLQQTRPGQRRFGRQFCQVIFSRWLDTEVTLGRLVLPGYWQRRSRYLRAARWLAPGVEGVDLLREARGALSLLAGGLEAPQEYLARRGLDPRETLRAIAEFQRMAKEEGVDLLWGQPPLKTNPAALGANGNGQ